MKLKVHRAKAGDIYRDIIRVPEIYRQDSNQETIPEGTICGVTINGIQAYALIRGLGDSLKQEIDIDERLRNRFGVKINDEIEVHLKKAGICGQFSWAWSASDPAYRVAARMALLSVFLGFVGFLLGLISLVIGNACCNDVFSIEGCRCK